MQGRALFEEVQDVERIINESDLKAAEKIVNQLNLEMVK